jgi:beta-glucosidase-like glycosyl hydrolase
LFIGSDAEWGLNMRLDSLSLSLEHDTWSHQDMKLLERVGAQMGEQSKRLGLQFNFAPVLDINTNPRNPIRLSFFFGKINSKLQNVLLQ